MYVIDREDFLLHEDRVPISEDLFRTVRAGYGSGYREPISVTEGEKLCFNLIWEEEFYYRDIKESIESKAPVFSNYNGEDLTAETDRLDFTFLDRFEEIVFEDVSEFSVAIGRLVTERRAGIRIVFLKDEPYVLSSVRYCLKRGEADPDKTAVFTTGNRIPSGSGLYSIYSLMISLTWPRIRHRTDGRTNGRQVLLVDFKNKIGGLGDLVKMASSYTAMAKQIGAEPLLCLDKSQYADYPGENCWNKFFNRISDADEDDIHQYHSTISVYENRPEEYLSFAPPNPYLMHYYKENPCRFSLEMNDRTLAFAKEKTPPPLLNGDSVLGAVIRTTDYDRTTGERTNSSRLADIIELCFEKKNYSYLYLATEDGDVLKLFRQKFGDRLLYIDQKRICGRLNEELRLLNEEFSEMYSSGYERGADYLASVYALTGCCEILYNREVGAVYLAKHLRSRILVRNTYVSLNVYALLLKIRENKLNTGVKIFAYGAGRRAKTLLPALETYFREIVFCDRHAEKGEYLLNGHRVISMEKMLNEYSGEPLLITPVNGRTEIYDTIVRAGIPAEMIFTE